MVIGDQHADAQSLGGGDPRMTRDTVVYRDNQIRLPLGGQCHDLRRQTVAKLEAIGHQKRDLPESHFTQYRDRQCRAGGAICIEISDDHDTGFTFYGIGQQCRCLPGALQCARGNQAAEGQVGLLRAGYTSVGINSLQ